MNICIFLIVPQVEHHIYHAKIHSGKCSIHPHKYYGMQVFHHLLLGRQKHKEKNNKNKNNTITKNNTKNNSNNTSNNSNTKISSKPNKIFLVVRKKEQFWEIEKFGKSKL